MLGSRRRSSGYSIVPSADPEPGNDLPTGTDREGRSSPHRKSRKSRLSAFADREAVPDCSVYDKLFLRHRNAKFSESLKLAARGTCILYLVGIPLILNLGDRSEYDPWRVSFFHRNDFFNPGNIVIFIYTLYKTFGETVSNGCDAIFGTLMAQTCAWALFWVFPQGIDTAGREALAQKVGFIFGPAFIVTVLFLNWRNLTQVFALANWVFHWMAFMEPGQAQAKSQMEDEVLGVHIHLFALESLITATGGVCFAIVATVIPYPLTAMQKARESADSVVEAIQETWRTAEDYYSATHQKGLVQVSLQLELEGVKEDINKLKDALENAWWERTFYCRWQRVYLQLSELNKVTRQVYDRIKDVVDSCLHEEFELLHRDFTDQCKESMHKAIKGTSDLLVELCKLCKKGGIENKAEVTELQQRITEVQKHRQEFTQQFVRFKREADKPGLSLDLLDEHVFGLEVCAYVTTVCAFGNELIKEFDAAKHQKELFDEIFAATKLVFSRPFDKKEIMNPLHLYFCLRNSLAILFSWFVGFHGYNLMILRYDAGIASTAAVLISKFSGSAIVKNLGRLQGVVVGLVAGMLVYALLGYCAIWAYVALSVAFFLYVGGSLFTYYHSEQYSYIGCLLAAFGTSHLLKGCTSEITDPTMTFYHVINVCVSIFIMGIVDALVALCASKPSKKAQEELLAALEQEKKLVENLLEPVEFELLPGMDSNIQKCIDEAEAMGNEAEEEPRYWRSPWKADLWKKGIQAVSTCRTQLHCYLCIMNQKKEPQIVETWCQSVLHMGSFRRLIAMVQSTLEQSLTLSKVFIADDIPDDVKKQIEEIDKQFAFDYEEKMEAVIEEFVTDAKKLHTIDQQPLEELETLEEVPSAQISILLSSFRVVHNTMNQFHFAILASS